MLSLFYMILALIGLSFLIFIHELGHYLMARRVGMRVETFAIGFGKPLYSFYFKDVKWQIGWIPFGGYVKIVGQDVGGDEDPYAIPDGFYGKSPWARIKVAFAGPFMNFLFAFIAFSLLWSLGGREKNFSEVTKKIGWVDPESELYIHGVRPGDEISAYDSNTYQMSGDHITGPLTAGEDIAVSGYKVDYAKHKQEPFDYRVKVYQHPLPNDSELMTAGILQPASYIIYDRFSDGSDNPLSEGSPLKESGIKLGDRIVWVDGIPTFSLMELNHLLNDNRVLLTINRDGQTYLKRVPRVEAQELRFDNSFREELIDWQYAAGLESRSRKLLSLYTIPYNITDDLVVEERLRFIDLEDEERLFPKVAFSEIEKPLLPGDKIIAVNGVPITQAYQLLDDIQKKRVLVIVERSGSFGSPAFSSQADEEFNDRFNWLNLEKMAASIGTGVPVKNMGNLYMLNLVTPKRQSEFLLSPEEQALFANQVLEAKKKIEGIEDPEKRAVELNLLENQENQLFLGLRGVQDRKVTYNPSPGTLFFGVFKEISHVLTSVASGSFSPKWLSGPVGIVYMAHAGAMSSFKVALFLMGLISLNLGFINMLPVPVLDGGTIVLSLYEWVTGHRIKPKTLEKLIIPFALLIVFAFVYLTYNDLARIFNKPFF